MTPDELRNYPLKDWTPRDQALYTQGYKDGYEAAQRERGPIEAMGKPLPPAVPPHFASEEPQGRPER